MNTPLLVDKRNLEIKFGRYFVGGPNALIDPFLHSRVQDYRRNTSGRMMPLDRGDVATKIPTNEYFASEKLDGEFTVLAFREDQAITLNPGGTVRMGLPAIDEAATLLGRAGVRSAIIAGELYARHTPARRERVHDAIRLLRGPESDQDLNSIRFAVFDLLELDDRVDWEKFPATWARITEIFERGNLAHPVATRILKNSTEISAFFDEFVRRQGGEGLVLRSDSAGLFKVKQRHTIDAVIIGFTESTGDRAGMVHDLLLALRREDGTYHVLSRVGGGFSDELRRSLLTDLKDEIVSSEYAEVNSDHVAYQMVQPAKVIEISCLDVISQTTRGAPINRMTLDWDASAATYRVVRRLPLVSVISPQFVRFREDKSTSISDVRIDQVAAVVEVPLSDRNALQMTMPKSEILRREVFKKTLKGETMVRKFLMWKTNKENVSREHPAFVIHFTDFSPNRATPLTRDIRVSNSRQQIDELFEKLKDENIKKGWEPVLDSGPQGAHASNLETQNVGTLKKKNDQAKSSRNSEAEPKETNESESPPKAAPKRSRKKGSESPED
jgi:ATP dependent DNA ligase C terminal region